MSNQPADSRLIKLGAELEKAWANERRTTRDRNRPDASVDKAVTATHKIVARIEKSPAKSLEGLRIKALACAWCHGGKRNIRLRDEPTTDLRLAQSIIVDLINIGEQAQA